MEVFGREEGYEGMGLLKVFDFNYSWNIIHWNVMLWKKLTVDFLFENV